MHPVFLNVLLSLLANFSLGFWSLVEVCGVYSPAVVMLLVHKPTQMEIGLI
jgi:hypothetical protein